MKNTKQGFTLIELLVVIAIIGILSSIVLASLNSARTKGADAAIKGNLANIRPQAEILYDNNSPNSYSGLCADARVTAAMTAAQTASGATSINTTLATAGSASTVTCHISATNDTWLIESPLKSDTSKAWCIDNTGQAKLEAAHALASAVACL